jgi:hypothetical protein
MYYDTHQQNCLKTNYIPFLSQLVLLLRVKLENSELNVFMHTLCCKKFYEICTGWWLPYH